MPVGAKTAVAELIGPTVKIEPGTAIGNAGVGIPKDKPPNAEVNPFLPADTPPNGPVLSLESALIISAVIIPPTCKSPVRFKLVPVFNLNAPPKVGSECNVISESDITLNPFDP